VIRRAAALKAPLRNFPLVQQRGYRSRLNREQSPWRMLLVPIFSVLFASILTTLPIIVEQAYLPPFGLLVLLSWRLMRPGIWPAWVGLPFGLFDDMVSGQVFGSAAFLWSIVMVGIEILDQRAAWRDHWQDWFVAGVSIIFCIVMQWIIVGWAYERPNMTVILPQIVFAILIFPLVVRLCARLDRWRLET
jgi:rod shape-determining protein MreD